MTSYLMIPVIFLYLMATGIGPVYLNPQSQQVQKAGETLRGTITVNKDLPEEFYGTWSVSGTIVKTNNPEFFKNKSSDLWVFSKSGNVITLANPVTKASASITVNEVQGKTATFTRELVTDKLKEREVVTLTVNGDKFQGKDSLTVESYFKGIRIGKNTVEYNVEGNKISGARLEELFSK